MTALSLGASPGCMTALAGRRVRAGVADVRTRLEARREAEREQAQQLADLTRAFADARARWGAGGSGTLMAASRLASEIAGLAARTDRLAEQVQQLDRERAAASQRLDSRLGALERSDGALADKVGLSIPDDKEELWRQAVALLASGSADQGRRYCRAFVDRFPQDPRAARAYLAIGRSYDQEIRYSQAATVYRDLIARYPGSPEVPEALWRLSRAFEGLSFCTDARALLRSLLDRFPHSPEAALALKELQHLKHPAVGAACVS